MRPEVWRWNEQEGRGLGGVLAFPVGSERFLRV